MFIFCSLIFVPHSFIHSHNFLCFGRSVNVGQCAFLFSSIDIQLINCFWKIRVALRKAGLVQLVQANLLILTDSAGCTCWEVLTVLDECRLHW